MFDFTVFPILKTDRLILREMQLKDTDAIFAIRGDYEVTQYNIGTAYTSKSQASDLISAMQDEYAKKSALRWGITRKNDDTVIGMVGFNYWNRSDHRASIGFDLAQAHWRQGFMREAVTAILQFGFSEMGLHRIEADASIYNTASIALLESLGFVREGVQRDQYYEDEQYHDLVLMALLKPQWHH